MSQSAVESFQRHLLARGLRPTSAQRYGRCLEKMLQHAGRPVEEITSNEVVAYLTDTAARLKSGSSCYNVHFHAMVRWLEMRGLPVDLKGLKPHRLYEQPPLWFTAKEVQQLLPAVRNSQHLVVFQVMLATGMRVGEVCALRVEDLSASDAVIRVHSGKGGDGRLVRFSPHLRKLLREYWRERRPKGLFFERRPGCDPRPLSPNALNATLRQASDVSGVSKGVVGRISVHRLRHTFAHQMLQGGIDVVSLQKELGHRSLDSTLRYVTPDLRRSPCPELDPLALMGVVP